MQQTKLALALNEAGLQPSVVTFDDRLILQKAVYLLQQAQVQLGYRFRWYIRGPYSSGLTEDVYMLAELQPGQLEEELGNWQLDPASKDRISKLRSWFAEQTKTLLAKKLELFASVLFLIVTQQAHADDSTCISKILKENDKPFESNEVEIAVGELRKHGYFTT